MAQMSQDHILSKLARRGHQVNTIIDVGASTGYWSAKASHMFPHAHFLLIEANEHHRPELEGCKKQSPRIDYILAGASDRAGTIQFFPGGDPFGGTTFPEVMGESREIPAITIDDEIARRNLPGPFLIKLDTHGREFAILEGAAQTLKRAQILVIEAYFFRIGKHAPLFYELCQFLAERNFVCVDFMEPQWRPYDQSLWQVDLVFVPATSPDAAYISFT
jgi:FkbM family methyltransferase